MNNKYIVYTGLEPRPEHAPKLRRLWASLKKQRRHNYEFRRNLARDYQVAKCAGSEGSRKG